MKKILFAAISTCLAAALLSPATAFAAEATSTAYPDIEDAPLTFEALTDYAIASDTLRAFAQGDTVYLLENENLTKFAFEYGVTALDYQKKDGAGSFYFTLSDSSVVYALPDSPDGQPEKAEDVALQSITDYYQRDGLIYIIQDGNLNIWDGSQENIRSYGDGECSHLKLYNDTLYLKNGNYICKIDGAEVKELVGDDGFHYSNYDLLTSIPVGNTLEILKTYNSAPSVVIIEEGSYITRFDINDLTDRSQHFSVTNPKSNTSKAVEGQALLLCKTGDIAIVAIGTDCYILNSNGTGGIIGLIFGQAEGNKATVNHGDYAHSTPFLGNPTRLFEISPAEEVTVLNKLSKEDYPQLAHDFYLIENSEGQTGYVVAEALENFIVVEGGATELPDRNPKDDNYIRTVVLVIVVVALALIGAGYVTWVTTTKRFKKVDNKDGEIEPEELSEDNE